MGCRKWVYAGLLWAAVVAARGQNPGQSEIYKSAERVGFFTGNVMLDDGSPPADAVRIEKVCDGRASFEAWTDEKGHFGFKVSPTVNDVSTGDASLPAAQRGELNKAINASSTQYSMPITSALRNCELRAVLSGYRSESVSMALKSTMDSARVIDLAQFGAAIIAALAGVIALVGIQHPDNERHAHEIGQASCLHLIHEI